MEKTEQEIVQILANGGVALFPTDTVYGIGCRYDNFEAMQRIYAIKRRPETQPTAILLADGRDLGLFVSVIPTTIQRLIDVYWPGGLTIALQTDRSNLGKFLVNTVGHVSFRVPNHSVTQQIIRQVGVPIMATSANFHGEPTPETYQDLNPELIPLTDGVLRGEVPLGKESTVIEIVHDGSLVLHREGAIPFADIQRVALA